MSVGGVRVARPPIRAEGGGSIPTSTLFRKEDWEVRPCSLSLVQKLVAEHHYARGGSNTATYTHGLFPHGAVWEADCKGVAWWIPPTKAAALKNYPKNWQGVLCLSRLVVLSGVPKNACSFLIRHAMRFIDRGKWPYLLTYADEWQGHDGAIYKAAGWQEDGYTKPQRCYVKDGRMVARKAGPRTRTHVELLALGCVMIGKFRKKRFFHMQSAHGGGGEFCPI